MAYQVFICYETTTGKEFASHLKEALDRVRIDSFVADEDIPKGADWRTIIDNAIKGCKYFVLIITIQACYSDEVKREIKLANEFHKLVLPCKFGGVIRTLTSRLPVVGKEVQQIDFTSAADLANKVTQEIFNRESANRLRAALDIRAFQPLELEELLQGVKEGSISKHGLLGQHFPNQDLRGLNFAGFSLMGSVFTGSNLDNVDFSDAALMGADFSFCSLRKVNMIGASLMGAEFRHADLRGACLKRAALMGAKLNQADLREIEVEGTHFGDADLEGTDLTGIIFDNITLWSIRSARSWRKAKLDASTLAQLNEKP
jgi:uncharacterized protein YjbI with pentapeptide repeats